MQANSFPIITANGKQRRVVDIFIVQKSGTITHQISCVKTLMAYYIRSGHASNVISYHLGVDEANAWQELTFHFIILFPKLMKRLEFSHIIFSKYTKEQH